MDGGASMHMKTYENPPQGPDSQGVLPANMFVPPMAFFGG